MSSSPTSISILNQNQYSYESPKNTIKHTLNSLMKLPPIYSTLDDILTNDEQEPLQEREDGYLESFIPIAF